VSVVVATHDRSDFLAECVATIVGSLGDGDEVIVVESGDSHAENAVGAVGRPVEVVRMLAREKTIKMNEGVRRSLGEVVLFTDDDCRVDATWVAGMAAPFAEPRVGAAFGPVDGLTSTPGGTVSEHLPPGPAPTELWAYSHGASMAVRRSALVQVGGFDERLGPGAPRHGEEGDIVLKLREAGWSIVLADAAAVRHLDWRNPAQEASNVLVYERGAGAYFGAGLRRSLRTTAKPFALRLRYQAALWGDRSTRGWRFGPKTTWTFLRGVTEGVALRPQRWL
jgi:GT2 family glycosyltransferase